MRRTFLAALLVVLFAAVLAPSATTKRTPPPTPSGTFTLNPGSLIALSNMTLSSEDQVSVGVCVMTGKSGLDCDSYQTLGDNFNASPGAVVQLNDWGYINDYLVPVNVLIGVIDYTTGAAYLSDGTLSRMNGTGLEPVSHVTLGWLKDTMVMSFNDGSQNTFTDWKPVLGAGNFNANVQLASQLPAGTGVTITKITGYSDGPTLDASNNPVCAFHTEFEYSANKAKTVQAAAAATGISEYTIDWQIGGSAEAVTLGASPFNPGTFTTATNLPADDYAFTATIVGSNKDLLALQLSSAFTLDPTTYIDGCPKVGQIISTSLGG